MPVSPQSGSIPAQIPAVGYSLGLPVKSAHSGPQGRTRRLHLHPRSQDGKALYLHCLPADINGVSCKDGEVEASVFDRYRDPLYKEASYKPYIIAAMILLAKQKDITGTLEALADKATPRHFGE